MNSFYLKQSSFWIELIDRGNNVYDHCQNVREIDTRVLETGKDFAHE